MIYNKSGYVFNIIENSIGIFKDFNGMKSDEANNNTISSITVDNEHFLEKFKQFLENIPN